MSYNKVIGDYGENIATEYLVKKGYKILERNIRAGYKEIDIIAKIKEKNEIIVFVEVKTRTSSRYGGTENCFSSKKMNNLKKAIKAYSILNKYDFNRIRLDLILVDLEKQDRIAKISHYKDIL